MQSRGKIKVAVLRGGPSSEYDVSLKSGETVLKHLPDHYDPLDIYISKDGQWHMHGISKEPQNILKHVDVVFNALHGEYGEDGTVQKTLETFGIPFTGSSSLSSAIAMNKFRTKEIAKLHNIKSPAHVLLKKDDSDLLDKLAYTFRTIFPPYIVKPMSLGSSVGIHLADDWTTLENAVSDSFNHSPAVMVEEFIKGKEATCAVLDNFRDNEIYSMFPIEIRPPATSKFFDYHAKYSGQSLELCPGNFGDDESAYIQELSRKVHEILGLRHYSRSDFIIHPKRGVFFLEVNTLPGLTSESLLPKAAAASGIPLPHFLDHVISLALQ